MWGSVRSWKFRYPAFGGDRVADGTSAVLYPPSGAAPNRLKKGIPLKVTSDDEIRARSQIEIPAGIRIECEAAADGRHVLSFGGSVFDGPRLVLDLQPGVADQVLSAVERALQ